MNDNSKFINAYKSLITEAVKKRSIPDDADFEKEMDAAIAAKELVTFKYQKKDGTSFTMTALPFRRFNLKGSSAVKAYLNGIEDTAHERTLYISSMGNMASKAGEAAAETTVSTADGLLLDANGKYETLEPKIQQAIEDGQLITMYVEKGYNESGDPYKKVTILPIECIRDYDDFSMFWVKGYIDGIKDEAHLTTIYSYKLPRYNKYATDHEKLKENKNISLYEMTPEMKALEGGLGELFSAHPEFKEGKTPYFWGERSSAKYKEIVDAFGIKTGFKFLLFFKPVGYDKAANRVVIEVCDSDINSDSYDDGDYDDGRVVSWKSTSDIFSPDPKEVHGYAWGTVVNDEIQLYNGLFIKKLSGTCVEYSSVSNKKWKIAPRHRRW